jgi:hypothetical protein
MSLERHGQFKVMETSVGRSWADLETRLLTDGCMLIKRRIVLELDLLPLHLPLGWRGFLQVVTLVHGSAAASLQAKIIPRLFTDTFCSLHGSSGALRRSLTQTVIQSTEFNVLALTLAEMWKPKSNWAKPTRWPFIYQDANTASSIGRQTGLRARSVSIGQQRHQRQP